MNLENMLKTIKGITKTSTLAAILAIAGPISCSKQPEVNQYYSNNGHYLMKMPINTSDPIDPESKGWMVLTKPTSSNLDPKKYGVEGFGTKDGEYIKQITIQWCPDLFTIDSTNYLSIAKRTLSKKGVQIIKGSDSKRKIGGFEAISFNGIEYSHGTKMYSVISHVKVENMLYNIVINDYKSIDSAEETFKDFSTNIVFYKSK